MFSLDQLQLPPPKNWQDLEILVTELFRAEWQDFHAQRHGRQGHSQQGVDIFGRPSSIPGWAGVQCKNKDLLVRATLTVEELRKEVRKAKSFQPPLKQFIIATTAPRNVHLQQEARKITDRHSRRGGFSVHVYGWDDIIELLAKHESVAMRYYGNIFGSSSGSQQPLFTEETMAVALQAEQAASGHETQSAAAPLVLSIPASRALGILATSPLPFSEDVYRQLFPDIDWKSLLPTLITAKAVNADASTLHVPESTAQSFFPSRTDSRLYIDAWITVLEPLQGHVDMAVCLSLLYAVREEYAKAVNVVVQLAPGLERGFWNELYVSVLQTYSQRPLFRCLSDQERRRFFVSYGLCLARGRTPSAALPWAHRLRKASKRAQDHEGLAHSLLLTGLAHQHRGNSEKAEDAYQQCAAYARRHRLPLLVGHALHNLAMLKVTSDPVAAARLLDQSIRAKKQAGDELGRVGAMFGRGTLAASQQKPSEAYKWFVRAEKLATRMDMRHPRALLLCNMATALVEQKRPRKAISLYQAAHRLAEDEGFADALALAAGGEALAWMAMKNFARGHDCFMELHRVQGEAGQNEAAVIAFHDAGVCLMQDGNYDQARKRLKEALGEALAHDIREWIYRCRKDSALTYKEEGNPARALELLREAAADEEHHRRFDVAAKLWETVATILAHQSPNDPLIEDAFVRAAGALEHQEGAADERLRLLFGLFVCRWTSHAVERALDTLRDIQRIAQDHHRHEALCRALNQRGTCLQQLGRPAEAIAEHRKALAIARRLPETILAEECLNNLGEALRKTNRPAAAIRAFQKAELLSHRRGDEASVMLTAHNRALTLTDTGRSAQARQILQRCRDDAQSLGLWYEHVRALHGLANHAWMSGKLDEALSQYRHALVLAKKYGISEEVAQIAADYAYALRRRKRPRRALRIMKAAEEYFLQLTDAHDYLAHLGEAAADAGDFSTARDAHTRAHEAAIRTGDVAGAADALSALAEISEGEADHARADELLREALALEQPPQQVVALLEQQLGVLLKAGKARQAGKVFRRLQDLAETDGLKEEAVDAYMLLGDHEWDTGRATTDAIKAYTAALIPATELGFEVMLRTGMHTVQRLLSLDAEHRLRQIDRIEKSLRVWLQKQPGAQSAPDAVAAILWPLRVARRVTGSPATGRSLTARQMSKILREEIFRQNERRAR